MSRKRRLRKNLGGETAQDDPRFADPYFDGPARAHQRMPVVMPERLLKAVLENEVARLSDPKNLADLERFFSHFFDSTASEEEPAQFARHFQKDPPRVILGYPRSTASWPIITIAHQAEEEVEEAGLYLGDYMGETQPGETPPGGEDQEYVGGIFEQVYSVFVAAQNPDVTLYLYHFAKFCLFAAHNALQGAGLITPRYSGGELNPEEMMMPDNCFVRVVTVRCRTTQTVPEVLRYRDGRRLRLTGIFRPDVVVNGMRGGVKSYVPTGDDDGIEE